VQTLHGSPVVIITVDEPTQYTVTAALHFLCLLHHVPPSSYITRTRRYLERLALSPHRNRCLPCTSWVRRSIALRGIGLAKVGLIVLSKGLGHWDEWVLGSWKEVLGWALVGGVPGLVLHRGVREINQLALVRSLRVLLEGRVSTQGSEVTGAEAPCEGRVVGVTHYVL